MPAGERPTVVIVGAGFAGVSCARGLARAGVRTVLVDRNNYHLFPPLLYQVATSALDSSDIAHPVRGVIRKVANAEFRLGEVEAIDLERRTVRTDRGMLPYDYLVLACGSQTTYFGNPSVAERSFAMKNLPDVLLLRNRILSRFEAADWAQDDRERKELLTFAIVGGGPAGVECAGAMAELIGKVLRRDFRELDMRATEILLLQSGPALLEPFDAPFREAALRKLRKMGVKVLLNTRVSEVRSGEIQLADGTVMPVGTVIWTAGVEGGLVPEGLAALESGGRRTLRVEPTLQVPGHPEVFVIGDLASFPVGKGALPQLAPVAIQGGSHAARNLRALVDGKPLAPFHYKDKGIMATVGRGTAVVQSGPIRLKGRLGWLTWLFLHVALIVGFRNRLSVLMNWTWSFLFWERPARLVIGSTDRRLERLAQVPYLHRALPDLSETDVLAMWANLHWEWARPGEVIIRADEAARSFYVVTSGEVEIAFDEGNGNGGKSARIGPGGFFGEVGCLTARSEGRITATVASELIALDRKGFIELMERSPVVRQDVEAQMRRLHELKYAGLGGEKS
jgi:NADH:ubiquinone reductase (H+-translocating)